MRTGHFDITLPIALSDLATVDFAFVDGYHRERPTIDYYRMISEHCRESSCIAIHDIYWSSEMTYAWNIITEDPRATVTIDLFDMGLVFFRKQAKEHFVLRW
jgi:hypothetical protein